MQVRSIEALPKFDSQECEQMFSPKTAMQYHHSPAIVQAEGFRFLKLADSVKLQQLLTGII